MSDETIGYSYEELLEKVGAYELERWNGDRISTPHEVILQSLQLAILEELRAARKEREAAKVGVDPFIY